MTHLANPRNTLECQITNQNLFRFFRGFSGFPRALPLNFGLDVGPRRRRGFHRFAVAARLFLGGHFFPGFRHVVEPELSH